jgi:hypothetical protein
MRSEPCALDVCPIPLQTAGNMGPPPSAVEIGRTPGGVPVIAAADATPEHRADVLAAAREHEDQRRERRFTKPEPYTPDPSDLLGFSAGVLRLEWKQPAESFGISGRAGRLHIAQIVEFRTRRGMLQSEAVSASLNGMIIRAPDGALSRVSGVEMFCTMIQVTGAAIGLLLVPVEET